MLVGTLKWIDSGLNFLVMAFTGFTSGLNWFFWFYGLGHGFRVWNGLLFYRFQAKVLKVLQVMAFDKGLKVLWFRPLQVLVGDSRLFWFFALRL